MKQRVVELAAVGLVGAMGAAYLDRRHQRELARVAEESVAILKESIDNLADEVATVGRAEAIVARARQARHLRLAKQD